MSPVVHNNNNNNNNSITYYNNMPHYHHPQVTSPSFSSASSTTSSSSTSISSAARLGQIRAQLELARNFYDDFEFCPIQCSSEVLEHRDRIQQRLSPQSSPNTSPSMSYASRSHSNSTTPKSRRAIPIIDPSNMAPVSVPNQHYLMKSSPIFAQQQQQQQQQHYWSPRSSMNASGYYDVLVQ